MKNLKIALSIAVLFIGFARANEIVECSEYIQVADTDVPIYCGGEVLSVLKAEYKGVESSYIHDELQACIGVNSDFERILLMTDNDWSIRYDMRVYETPFLRVNVERVAKTIQLENDRTVTVASLRCSS